MLRLDGVQAGYDGTQVLWDVTLAAEKGAMTVLIGPNGAGKSTTLKVINGLVRPTRGHVVFQGEDVTGLMGAQHAYAALRIAEFGYVRQNGHVVKSGPPDQLLDLEELRKAYFAIP